MSVSFNIKANENGRQVIFDKGYGGEGALSLEPDGKLNYYYGKREVIVVGIRLFLDLKFNLMNGPMLL